MKNILNLETYGKKNFISKEFIAMKTSFRVNHDIEKYLGLKVYKPAMSKIRLAIGGLGVVGCIATPFTNFMIPFIVRWSLR